MTRPAHHHPAGGFRNPWPNTEPPGFGSLLKWGLERRTTRRPPREPRREIVPPRVPKFHLAPPDGLAITWLGHSTLLVESGAATVLTDPVFGDYASPIALSPLRRWARVPVRLEELPTRHGADLAQPLRSPRRAHGAPPCCAAATRGVGLPAGAGPAAPGIRGQDRRGSRLVGAPRRGACLGHRHAGPALQLRRQLFRARDILSLKPLYYCLHGDTFC